MQRGSLKTAPPWLPFGTKAISQFICNTNPQRHTQTSAGIGSRAVERVYCGKFMANILKQGTKNRDTSQTNHQD